MSLKIYFCGSITGGRGDVGVYETICDVLRKYGTVLTEHDILGFEKKPKSEQDNLPSKEIHDRDLAWLKECDVVIAEVTQPSLGVGYEIGRAIDLEKPILCLFRPECGKKASCMIEGADNGDSFQFKNYKVEEAPKVIKSFLNRFEEAKKEEPEKDAKKWRLVQIFMKSANF